MCVRAVKERREWLEIRSRIEWMTGTRRTTTRPRAFRKACDSGSLLFGSLINTPSAANTPLKYA